MKSEEGIELLTKIIAKQTCLELLVLEGNDLSSSILTRIMSTIRASPSIKTIKQLYMAGSYWNETEVC